MNSKDLKQLQNTIRFMYYFRQHVLFKGYLAKIKLNKIYIIKKQKPKHFKSWKQLLYMEQHYKKLATRKRMVKEN